MEYTKVSSFIDLDALGAEKEAFEKMIEGLIAKVRSVGQAEVKLTNATTPKDQAKGMEDLQKKQDILTAGSKEYEKALLQQAKAQKILAEAAKATAEAKLTEAKASEILTNAALNEAKAATENAKAKLLEAKAVAELNKQNQQAAAGGSAPAPDAGTGATIPKPAPASTGTDATGPTLKPGLDEIKAQVAGIRALVDSNQTYADSFAELLKAYTDNQLGLKDLATARKSLNAAFQAGDITAIEYRDALVEVNDAELGLKVSNQDLTKLLKNLEKQAQAADGSLEKMRAELILLQSAYAKMSDEEKSSPLGQGLAKQAEELSSKINEQQKKVGDYTKNIGRYAESLADGFEKVRREISSLQKKQDDLNKQKNTDPSGFAARGGDKEIARTTAAIEQLTNVEKISYKTNLTGAQAVKALSREYENLALSGNVSKEFLKEFKHFVAESKDQVEDLRDEIKHLSSDTHGLDQAVGVISTIASGFEAASGAAALFGADQQDVERSLQKLVAIQSIANGIREIGNQITERGTIANKAAVAVQNLWTTATDRTAAATVRLKAALGLFAILATVIIALVAAFYLLRKAQSEEQKQAEAFLEIQKQAVSGYAKEVTQLEILGRIITDHTLTRERRNNAVEDYNKIADKSNQIDKTTIDNTVLIEAAIARQIELIKKRALARAAENVIAEKAEAVFKIQIEIDTLSPNINPAEIVNNKRLAAEQKDLLAQAEKAIQARKTLLGVDKVNLEEVLAFSNLSDKQIDDLAKKSNAAKILLDKTTKEQLKAIDKRRAEIVASQNTALSPGTLPGEKLEGLFDDLTKAQEALDRSLKAGFDLISQAPPPPKAATPEKKEHDADADLFKSEQEKRKFLFDIQQKVLQDKIDNSALIVDDEKKSFDERLKAAQDFYDLSLLLIQKQRDFANNETDLSAEEEKRKAKKEIKDKAQLQKVLLSIDEKAKAERLKNESKFNGDVNALTNDDEKKRAAIIKKNQDDIEAHRQSLHEQEMTDIQIGYDLAILELDKSLAKKQISEKEYNKEKLRLQVQQQAELLKADIRYAKETIAIQEAIAAASGNQADIDKVAAAKSKLAALEIKLAGIIADFKIKKNNDETKSDAELFAKRMAQLEKIKNYATEVYSIVGGFIDANATKEKNAIQGQIDALEAKRLKDIQVAEQTSANAQELADRTTSINNRADAERKQLEARQKKADEQKARFEKASNIASIIMETSLAVIRALGDKTVPLPARIAGAVAIGAIGAAKLAVAIATPIPKYKDGLKQAKEDHFGITGDGGRHELLKYPDGTGWITPDKPTLTWIPKGSEIVSSVEPRLPEDPEPITQDNAKPVKPKVTPARESQPADITVKAVVKPMAEKKEVTRPAVHDTLETVTTTSQTSSKTIRILDEKRFVHRHLAPALSATVSSPDPKIDLTPLIDAVVADGKATRKAIQGKKENHIQIVNGQVSMKTKDGYNETTYLNNNLQFP